MVQIKINEDGTIYVGVEWSGDSRAIIGRALEIDLSGISYLLD